MGGRRRVGAGELVMGVLVLGLVLLILKWALITAAILAVPFAAWWSYDRYTATKRDRRTRDDAATAARRRADVESRAVVDVAGGCGWCGSRVAHRDGHGRLVLPRSWHHDEIEEFLRVPNGASASE